MRLTALASCLSFWTVTTNDFNFRTTEGLMSGIRPSYIPSTTSNGDLFKAVAFASISEVLWSQTISLETRTSSKAPTFSPIPRVGMLTARVKAGTKWGLSITWRYDNTSLIFDHPVSKYKFKCSTWIHLPPLVQKTCSRPTRGLEYLVFAKHFQLRETEHCTELWARSSKISYRSTKRFCKPHVE